MTSAARSGRHARNADRLAARRRGPASRRLRAFRCRGVGAAGTDRRHLAGRPVEDRNAPQRVELFPDDPLPIGDPVLLVARGTAGWVAFDERGQVTRWRRSEDGGNHLIFHISILFALWTHVKPCPRLARSPCAGPRLRTRQVQAGRTRLGCRRSRVVAPRPTPVSRVHDGLEQGPTPAGSQRTLRDPEIRELIRELAEGRPSQRQADRGYEAACAMRQRVRRRRFSQRPARNFPSMR